MYTALVDCLASAQQLCETLKYTERQQLYQLSIALCKRLDISVPKYRTLRNTNKRTQDVSKVLEALVSNLDTCVPKDYHKVPEIKVNTLRYLVGLRKYRTNYNTECFLQIAKHYYMDTKVTFSSIKALVGQKFAETATYGLSPEDRPYWFGYPDFDNWAAGKSVDINDVLQYTIQFINKLK